MCKYRYRFNICGFGIYRLKILVAEFHNFRLTENGKLDCDIKYHVNMSKPMECFDGIAKSRLFRAWKNGNVEHHFVIKGNVPFEELSQDWKNLCIR